MTVIDALSSFCKRRETTPHKRKEIDIEVNFFLFQFLE